MQASDLEMIRDIPGFQMIMKVILKNQIQRMVEQLAEYTGEESVILTASVSDGSLSHLGSESGKAFLEVHDGIKPQFLGFCLKMHHQQERLDLTNKQEFLDSSGDLRQKFGPGSTQHGTRPYTVPDVRTQSPNFGKSSLKASHGSASKSMRHDPYPVSLPKHPMYQSVMKQRKDLVTNQTVNNVPIDDGSRMEKDADDTFTGNIQEAMKFTGNIEEAMRIRMEAEDNETESDDYSESGDDGHPSSQYSGQDSVGQFEIQVHKPAESKSEKSTTVTKDDQDSRPNESGLAPDEPEADVSNGSRASSDKDTGYFPPAVSDRPIKVEMPSESEMEQDNRAVPGKMPTASGNMPSASGNMPSASGNMPSASGDWMMNLHEMIGSIAAASGATSLGDTTQESPHHRNSPLQHVPHHRSPSSLQHSSLHPGMPRENEWPLPRPNSNRKKIGVPRLLPQSATGVMKEWLYKNVQNPYPSEEVKQEMAKQTSLSLLQINNWFTNARRRIIQPMLDAKKTSDAVENLAKCTSPQRSIKSEPDPDPRELLLKSSKLPLAAWQTIPYPYYDPRVLHESMEPDDLSIKKKTL